MERRRDVWRRMDAPISVLPVVAPSPAASRTLAPPTQFRSAAELVVVSSVDGVVSSGGDVGRIVEVECCGQAQDNHDDREDAKHTSGVSEVQGGAETKRRRSQKRRNKEREEYESKKK